MTDRAFGRDMNRVRLGILNASSDLAPARQSAAQIRIGRNGKGRKALRRQERNRRAEASQAPRERPKCAHDSVDLRLPSIGCDQKMHQDGDIHRGGAAGAATPSIIRVRRDSCSESLRRIAFHHECNFNISVI